MLSLFFSRRFEYYRKADFTIAMRLTAGQQQAISARGNVLVVAGAGTGKTSTLVERCMNCLIEASPPASIDEILMVTFTDAAAAEMRQRIRSRLEEQLQKEPDSARWQEQLALFETAHLGTLHSFCLQLIRQHFYLLELDPQLSVMREEESWLLANETLDEILEHHYAGETPEAIAVQELIQVQGNGWDGIVRSLILYLHRYSQTLPDPEGWFRQQLSVYSAEQPAHWEEWLLKAMVEWRKRWLTLLAANYVGNGVADKCLAELKQLAPNPARAEAAAALEKILAACEKCPWGKKTEWLKPLGDFEKEAEFLFSLAARNEKGDPLIEDWGWVRTQMSTLLNLAQQFGNQFRLSKREFGTVDFHDLEQYALRLLWDTKEDRPSKIAEEWREKLRFVFVDEYQDINAAQDKIIQALGRHLPNGNRFLVGDVKQSIYRFRLANPRIFQNYAQTWRNDPSMQFASQSGEVGRGAPPAPPDSRSIETGAVGKPRPTFAKDSGTAIPLVDNFRSREGIINFVNSFFALVMRAEIGGVLYDEEAKLRFGAPAERSPLSTSSDSAPRVELHLRIKKPENGDDSQKDADDALAEISDMQEADKEARLVALRLRDMKMRGHQIWDETSRQFRAAEWADMTILLRSPSGKAESYAKEFARLGVPLQVERGGFYESMEILDLLSLLQLLDNPLQDLPAIAVLHSPLVGLNLNELAEIRLATRGHFWRAVLAWHEHESANPETASSGTLSKVSVFLDQFNRWRRLARQVSLSRCLEAILAETHYDSWVLTQPRGALRHANVQRLLGLAQQFDQFQRQSLFRFLQFIEAQKLSETEPDVAAASQENSVRLMSIHQSKGLEFPIVVLADLGKPFNLADLKADIILDEEFGLCPQIKPPHSPRRYPSLPYWLARQRQRRELLGEELRLMYVAMTRARDTMLLSGTIAESRYEKVWNQNNELNVETIAAARSYSDWLGLWFSQVAAARDKNATEGEIASLRWVLHTDASLVSSEASTAASEPSKNSSAADASILETLRKRIEWKYPFISSTREPAKTSVSALRRRANESMGEEAAELFQNASHRSQAALQRSLITDRQSRTDFGSAHHKFLQLVSLDHVGSAAELKAEAEKLARQKSLTPEEAALLDFNCLAGFWRSAVGERIRPQKDSVRRELRFTARLPANEIAELTGETPGQELANEFVIIQGVVDLAVLLPKEIWLVDFKTDAVKAHELQDKGRLYEPQLKLYARALSEIYRRPVSEAWLYFLSVGEAVEIELIRNRVSTAV
jgi:ATP-dependent helicase/nuclease subunit A